MELDAATRRGSPYEIVLSDYMMPGADGGQLARILRAENRPRRRQARAAVLRRRPDARVARRGRLRRLPGQAGAALDLLDTLASLGGRFQPAGAATRPSPRAPTAPRGRVLVVEDNPINQLVAEGILEPARVRGGDGRQRGGRRRHRRRRPHAFVAVLMDCQMPVMDGFNATRAIRAIQADGTRTPIIAMTAAAVAEERDRCLEAGMDDFLTKPIDVTVLEQTLDKWTGPAEPDPSAPSAAAAGPSPAAVRLGELIDLDGVDPSLVARMVDRFGGIADAAVAALAEATDAGNAGDVTQQAHSLRGSASNLGLDEVAAISRRVELAAKEGVLPSPAEVTNLRDAVTRGAAELRAVMQARG